MTAQIFEQVKLESISEKRQLRYRFTNRSAIS